MFQTLERISITISGGGSNTPLLQSAKIQRIPPLEIQSLPIPDTYKSCSRAKFPRIGNLAQNDFQGLEDPATTISKRWRKCASGKAQRALGALDSCPPKLERRRVNVPPSALPLCILCFLWSIPPQPINLSHPHYCLSLIPTLL